MASTMSVAHLSKHIKLAIKRVDKLAPNLVLDHVQLRASAKFLQTGFENDWLELKQVWALTTDTARGETRSIILYGKPNNAYVEFFKQNGMSIDYTFEHEWEVARLQATGDLREDARRERVHDDDWFAIMNWFCGRKADGPIR